MAVVYANNSNFDKTVERGLTLIDFYAEWCGPCKMIAPVLEELASSENLNVVKINVDSERELAEKYNIMSIPTLMIFKDGNAVSTKMGFQSKEMLTNWINENK